MNDSSKVLLPALLAVGSGFAATDAAAIELGEISVQSRLGQPLRASIAYALGPNETLAQYCVGVAPGLSANGLPAVTRADLTIADGIISITGRSAIREPLVSMRLDVACPYTPHISRDYMLFIDPAEPVSQAVAEVQTQPQSESVAITRELAAPVAETQAANVQPAPVRRAQPAPSMPITNGERYRVQPGDSLSQIAQRIENRKTGLWAAVGEIFEANPGAFIDNDPNKLKAGSLLVIPNFGPDARLASTDSVFRPEAVADAPAPIQPAAEPVAAAEPATDQGYYPEAPGVDTVAMDEQVSAPADPVIVDNAMADLQPGDVIAEPPTSIPDTELEGPATTSTSPNVPTAVVVPAEPAQTTSGTNWFWWLAGTGLALIVGLLMFGRRGRSNDDEAVIAAAVAPHPMRRTSDLLGSDTMEVEEITQPSHTVAAELEERAETEAVDEDVDYELEDDSPTQENLALDADLEIGTGLSEGTDMHVAEDFGYDMLEESNADLDLELPEEAGAGESRETDIIAAPRIEQSSILEKEVLPDDDEYDMSVIVDATKMPQPDDATRHDFKAVVVDDTDKTLIRDDYTMSREIDYQILEQDYEEEMTATQALNLEIERAAAELADRMEDDDADDMTSEMPLATVTEIDVTANLPASGSGQQDEEISDLDDTGVNEEITEKMIAEDKTVEMPAKGGKGGHIDDTVEMTVESGKVDTKAG